MAFIKKGQSTMKQMAYAKRTLGGQGTSKKENALNSGYSPYVANSISSHIENKPGFNHAMSKLAVDSNNLAMAAMHEFKARGFKDFSNKELVGALNAIGNAWAKFNAPLRDNSKPNPSGNKLRTVVLQQIENQNVQLPAPEAAASSTPEPDDKPDSEVKVADVSDPMDF